MIGHMKLSVLVIIGFVHFTTATTCPGCPVEINKNDPEVQNYLTTTLSNYKSTPKGTENERTTMVELMKVTSQIVNGVKYTYSFKARGVKTNKNYECKLVVYSRPWVGERTVNDYNCQEIANRKKRSLPGGDFKVNLDDKIIVELQQFIGQELTKKQQSKYAMGVVKVLKATQQIVSGWITRLTVEVAQTKCPAESNTKDCSFQEEGHQVCNVAVWEKPWLQMKKMISHECSDVPKFCAGCPWEVSPVDVDSTQCLSRTIFNNNLKSPNKQLKLKKINKVQKQVVAGLKYSFDFEVEDGNAKPYLCNAVVLSQPWVSAEPMVEQFDCSPKVN